MRAGEHRTSIVRKDIGNAFAKHLAEEEHPERQGDVAAFKFTVLKTYRKSLYRQVAKPVKIYGSQATIVLNSKAEWHQPSVERVVITRDLPERQQVRMIGA